MQYYIQGKPPFKRNKYPFIKGISPIAPRPSANDSMTRNVLRRVFNYSPPTPAKGGIVGGSGPFRNSFNLSVTNGNNSKFVSDASEYARFKRQCALARNYEDFKK
jgi:hypothetical protein